MKASEYLQQRQGFLAFESRWVNHLPRKAFDEDGLDACALLGGKYPLGGATCRRNRVADRAYRFLLRGVHSRGHSGGVGGWNDQAERTLVEVLDLFDDAIRLAKEAGD